MKNYEIIFVIVLQKLLKCLFRIDGNDVNLDPGLFLCEWFLGLVANVQFGLYELYEIKA